MEETAPAAVLIVHVDRTITHDDRDHHRGAEPDIGVGLPGQIDVTAGLQLAF
jgi:hypothetical protein